VKHFEGIHLYIQWHKREVLKIRGKNEETQNQKNKDDPLVSLLLIGLSFLLGSDLLANPSFLESGNAA